MSTSLDLGRVKSYFEKPERYLNGKNGVSIRLRAEILQRMLGDVRGKSICDLGCGDGSVSLPLLARGAKLWWVDLSKGMIERARARVPHEYSDQVTTVNASIGDFAPGRTFDVVLCIGVLAHVPSVSQAIEKCASLTAPGGVCVLQLTDAGHIGGRLANGYWRLRRSLTRGPGHAANTISESSVQQYANDHGFDVVRQWRHLLILPGLGKLPESWLWRFEQLAMNHRRLSSLSADLMIELRRK